MSPDGPNASIPNFDQNSRHNDSDRHFSHLERFVLRMSDYFGPCFDQLLPLLGGEAMRLVHSLDESIDPMLDDLLRMPEFA